MHRSCAQYSINSGVMLMFKPGFATVALAIINLSLGSYVAADPPRVVTDIALVHALVSRVMEGIAEVQLVIPIGALPHD